MARRQSGAAAVTLAVLAAVLIGASLPSAVSAKPHQHLKDLLVVLNVTSDPSDQRVVHPGDKVTVSWSPNATVPADAATVKVELCFAPVSRKDRGWRKQEDDLFKDKSCQFKVTDKPYGSGSDSFQYTVARDVPSAVYFVRAYVLNGDGKYLAYGQTNATTGAFQVQSITGITTSIQVAAGVFSAFSVVSLAFFFVVEKRKKDK